MKKDNITPMTRLKGQFIKINNLLHYLTRVELNKRGEKSSYYYYRDYDKKEIINDFSRIYKIDDNISFAFVFNYETKEEFNVVIKIGDVYENSNIFNYVEFKKLLSKFILVITDMSEYGRITNEVLLNIIRKTFGVITHDKTVDEIISNIKESLKIECDVLIKLNKESSVCINNIEKANMMIYDAIDKYRKQLETEYKLKELTNLVANVNKRTELQTNKICDLVVEKISHYNINKSHSDKIVKQLCELIK